MVKRIIRSVFIFIVVSAVFITILRVFGWDVFGFADWVCNATMYAISHLSDMLMNPIRSLFGK